MPGGFSSALIRSLAAGMSSWGRYFFFSSRRRHTRCSRDWSSDVCSSDLTDFLFKETYDTRDRLVHKYGIAPIQVKSLLTPEQQAEKFGNKLWERQPDECCNQIGRASCRERG